VGSPPHIYIQFNLYEVFSSPIYENTYPQRKEIRDKVWELHQEGWGYTKIHHYLIKNGYEVGKSRTTVDSMIKKMKKRGFVLGLEDVIRKYENIKIQYFRV
jgi:hypothetical protein